ncbi:hypothetical protein QUF76_05015 [Desulfobacterales bacterium HSG16]|nr:hypothetical protein [Desulfobacterales bacterium HSG16]
MENYQRFASHFQCKNEIFSVKSKEKKARVRIYKVTRLSKIGIKQYVKVRVHENPHMKEFGGYFYKRRHDKKAKLALTWR